MDANTARGSWAPEREIVLTRVIDAPRDLVFEAWTKPEHVSRWFGPKGFVTTTHEMVGQQTFDKLAEHLRGMRN